MLWNPEERYLHLPFENEAALEEAVSTVKDALFEAGGIKVRITER